MNNCTHDNGNRYGLLYLFSIQINQLRHVMLMECLGLIPFARDYYCDCVGPTRTNRLTPTGGIHQIRF